MAFKAAICPSCGGNLQVPDDRDSVKCMYCGTDIIVRQAIQAGSGVNIQNYLELAVTANKTGNYQEAYNYYSKVLEYDINNSEAWFGKARAVGWLSDFNDFRDSEIISGFQNSLDKISDKDKKDLQIQCASEINQLSIANFNLIHRYVAENAEKTQYDKDIWNIYVARCESLISLQEFGFNLNPNNQEIMEGIINICKTNLEGVECALNIESTVNGRTSYRIARGAFIRRVSENERQFFTNKMNFYSEKLKDLNPNYKPPEIKKKSSCCFVITATMENRNHPYVLTLQDFRESWLLKRGYGRQFNHYYEIFGPHLADIIRDRWILRMLSLNLIVRPSVWIVSKCTNTQKIEI